MPSLMPHAMQSRSQIPRKGGETSWHFLRKPNSGPCVRRDTSANAHSNARITWVGVVASILDALVGTHITELRSPLVAAMDSLTVKLSAFPVTRTRERHQRLTEVAMPGEAAGPGAIPLGKNSQKERTKRPSRGPVQKASFRHS